MRRNWTLFFQGCSHINKQFCLQNNELVGCSVPSPKPLEFLTIIINYYLRINTLKADGKIIWSPQRHFSTICLTTNFWVWISNIVPSNGDFYIKHVWLSEVSEYYVDIQYHFILKSVKKPSYFLYETFINIQHSAIYLYKNV